MNTHNQKVIISRDVMFHKNTHIERKINTNEDEEELNQLIDLNLFTFPKNPQAHLTPQEQPSSSQPYASN